MNRLLLIELQQDFSASFLYVKRHFRTCYSINNNQREAEAKKKKTMQRKEREKKIKETGRKE